MKVFMKYFMKVLIKQLYESINLVHSVSQCGHIMQILVGHLGFWLH